MMRKFWCMAVAAFAPVLWMFYGRADKWWAWGLVALIWTAVNLAAPQRVGEPDTVAWKAFLILEFVLISASLLYLRKRRQRA